MVGTQLTNNVAMKRQYFGTDGVRGRAGEHPMTADFALRLGYSAGHVLHNLRNQELNC